jgi:hypothetical protein
LKAALVFLDIQIGSMNCHGQIDPVKKIIYSPVPKRAMGSVVSFKLDIKMEGSGIISFVDMDIGSII